MRCGSLGLLRTHHFADNERSIVLLPFRLERSSTRWPARAPPAACRQAHPTRA